MPRLQASAVLLRGPRRELLRSPAGAACHRSLRINRKLNKTSVRWTTLVSCSTSGEGDACMSKNLGIGTKLIIVGTLIVVIPLTCLAIVALTIARTGLEQISDQQLTSR